MKFWKTTVLSSIFILGLFLALVLHILQISSSDQKEYKKLMDVSNSKTTLKNDSDYTAKQLKSGTAKTLLLTQGNDRKVGSLACESSILYFAKEKQTSELIEEMKGVHLIYQEELVPEGQITLHLEAENATYFYSQEKLMAEKVQFARFRIPSHVFSTQEPSVAPFFKGTADRIAIGFGSIQPTMQATNLKAASE